MEAKRLRVGFSTIPNLRIGVSLVNGFFAILSRMKYIRRWGLMRNAREENLSEHSLEVAVIAHALAVIGNRRLGRQYREEQVTLCAMYHDVSEIITGDLPTPVKYFSPHIRNAYKEVEQTATHQLLSLLPEDLAEVYRGTLFMEGLDAKEKNLVKAADKLSALIKCIEEERAGSHEFKDAKIYTQQALEEMNLPEVSIFMEDFLPAYQGSLDQLTLSSPWKTKE